MADVIFSEDGLWIADIGCGMMRRALLALETGSRIWLEIEGEAVLFERMADVDGESKLGLKPVGETAALWANAAERASCVMPEVEFIERPADRGKASKNICDEHTDQNGLHPDAR